MASFTGMDWSDGAHPLEHKKNGSSHVTLLQFEPGFSDPNWCERSHVFFVVDGTLHVEFQDDSGVELVAGNALWISSGTAHRASVRSSQVATVFVVSDLTLDPQPESVRK
jgi:quercetin dioxygenase-like cupin family protein